MRVAHSRISRLQSDLRRQEEAQSARFYDRLTDEELDARMEWLDPVFAGRLWHLEATDIEAALAFLKQSIEEDKRRERCSA